LLFVAESVAAVVTGELVVTKFGLDAQLTGAQGTAAFGLWLTLGFGYHTLLEWRLGTTTGNRLVQIRVQGEAGTPASSRTVPPGTASGSRPERWTARPTNRTAVPSRRGRPN
jgi:hypothetical protein